MRIGKEVGPPKGTQKHTQISSKEKEDMKSE